MVFKVNFYSLLRKYFIIFIYCLHEVSLLQNYIRIKIIAALENIFISYSIFLFYKSLDFIPDLMKRVKIDVKTYLQCIWSVNNKKKLASVTFRRYDIR